MWVCAWTRNDECDCGCDDTRCEQCAEAQQGTSIAGADMTSPTVSPVCAQVPGAAAAKLSAARTIKTTYHHAGAPSWAARDRRPGRPCSTRSRPQRGAAAAGHHYLPWFLQQPTAIGTANRPAVLQIQDLGTRSVEITVSAPTSSEPWDMNGSRSRPPSGPTTDNAAALSSRFPRD